jgi:hypothetical protein
MAKMNEYHDWKADAIAFWEQKIIDDCQAIADSGLISGYDMQADVDNFTAQMVAYMNAFDTRVNAYLNDNSRREPFIGAMFSLSNYIANKFVAPSPEAPVGSVALLPNDSAKDLFAWWRTTLPNYEGFFEVLLIAPPPPMEGAGEGGDGGGVGTYTTEFRTTDLYTNALEMFSSYVSDDLGRFEVLSEQIPRVISERVAYGFFAGADAVIVPSGKDIKGTLLDEFGVNDILTQFNWTIKGIN